MNLLSYVLLFIVAVAFVVALRLAFSSRKGRGCCSGGDCDKCKAKFKAGTRNDGFV